MNENTNSGRIRLGLNNIMVIALVILGFSLTGIGVSYGFSDIKNDADRHDDLNNANTCLQVVSELSDVVLNNACDEYKFYVNDVVNNISLEGFLNSYDESNHYTLGLIINGKEVTTDFFTNKDKVAIFVNIFLENYGKYVIVKSDSGAQYNGQYLAVINSENGNVDLVFENGSIDIENEIITVSKNDGTAYCDGTSSSIITGKEYVYKMDDNGVSLLSEKDETCGE